MNMNTKTKNCQPGQFPDRLGFLTQANPSQLFDILLSSNRFKRQPCGRHLRVPQGKKLGEGDRKKIAVSVIDPRLISYRPGEMGFAEEPRPLIWDGMGALVEDLRPLLDIIVEPGVKFAPFQGLSAEMVAQGFAESNGTSDAY